MPVWLYLIRSLPHSVNTNSQ